MESETINLCFFCLIGGFIKLYHVKRFALFSWDSGIGHIFSIFVIWQVLFLHGFCWIYGLFNFENRKSDKNILGVCFSQGIARHAPFLLDRWISQFGEQTVKTDYLCKDLLSLFISFFGTWKVYTYMYMIFSFILFSSVFRGPL